jgi:spore germination protein YaaH
MAAVLADPAQRAAHVSALVNLAVANGYAGIDLDYEQFAFADGTSSWAATRPLWVQFISELGPALHARAKLLTVTTPPISNGSRAPGSGYWVYDWGAIAPFIDRLRIMSYEFSSSSPGPMAPLWWVQQIVAHAVTVVPPSKVQVGVPAYGRNFVAGVTSCERCRARPLRRANVNTAALSGEGRYPVAIPSGEMTFSYVETFTGPPPAAAATTTAAPPPAQVTCQVTRTVWYPDLDSIMAKAHLVGTYGISGIAQWA